MSVRELPRTIDLFDDPPWSVARNVARSHGRLWMAVALGVCTLSAATVALSTTLPWFGADDGSGIGGVFGLVEQKSALSPDIASSLGHSGLVPGSQSWGFVIVALSLWTALAAFVVTVLVLGGKRRPPAASRAALVVLTLALVIVCVLEARAQPLYGDGPILRFSWGAIVGVGAAALSLLGASLALLMGRREPN